MNQVKECMLSLTIIVDFEAIAELLNITEDKVRELWDNGDLQDALGWKAEIEDVLDICEDPFEYGGFKVGRGYM